MKTKLFKAFLILFLICFFSLDLMAAYVPMPMPIPIYHSGGGSMSGKEAFAILIAFNVIFIVIYAIRSIMWLIKKPKNLTFVKYVIWSDFDMMTPDMTTIFFGITNGVALIMVLCVFIYSLL